MRKLNNKGFGVVEGLLALVIVGIVSGTILYVYNANKKVNNGSDGTTITQTEKQASESPAQKPAQDLNKGYVVVKEWSIRIKLRDSDRVKSYDYSTSDNDGYRYYFSDIKADSTVAVVVKPYKEKGCTTEHPGAVMFRSATKPKGDSKKIGDYYFFAKEGPNECLGVEPSALSSRILQDFEQLENIEILP